MRFLTRLLPAFFVSWLLTFTLASLFHSQYIVNQLVKVGVVVALRDRWFLSLEDWLGLLPTYGAIIAVAFTVAFLVAGGIYKLLGKQAVALFALAGVTAFFTVLLAIHSVMNIHLIAGARGWGFYMQLLAGAIGGVVFAKIMKFNQ